MGTVSPQQVSDGTSIDAADVNTPVNQIADEFNGNIENVNIKSNAAIAGSKLADTSINITTKASDWDGWISVTDSWAYASATTITVPSDATAKYSVGDKIKFTQTSTKYFYIVAVSATTLTVTGGADYTVANAAISGIYYSKAATPLGFPQWFNYTVTWTGFSSNPSGGNTKFCINGRMVTVSLNAETAGTSNSTSLTATLPVTAANTTGGWRGINGSGFNNGTATAGADYWQIAAAGTTVGLFVGAGTNWTAANGKNWRGVITYEI